MDFNLVKELRQINEAGEFGQGLEPLLDEFVNNRALDTKTKETRHKAITNYYKRVLEASRSISKAYNKTHAWATKIYIKYIPISQRELHKDVVDEAKDLEQVAKDIDDLIKIQANDPSTKVEDYMKGLGNGLAVAKACVDGYEPNFVTLPEKERFFIERTTKHINLVKKLAKNVVDVLPEYKELLNHVEYHDDSKFHSPERKGYIELTWDKFKGIKNHNPLTNEVTLHHIENSQHHPEFWSKEKSKLDSENRDKALNAIDASKMPDIWVIEMTVDWVAMGIELGNKARDWFNKQKDTRWKFTKHQEELIDKILNILE